MSKKLASCIYRARPYVGVAFMWRKNISKIVSVVGADGDGRCLCIAVNLDPVIRFFSVYFPCTDSSAVYESEISTLCWIY
jgi:exonuclease III